MKKNLAVLAVIAAVMFGLPWGAVTFAPGDAGMAVCFVLFFGVNVMASLFVGIFAGLHIKGRWYLPAVNAGMFLLGAWTVFDWGNPDFGGFAAAYLAIGIVAMLATVIVVRNVRRELARCEE